MFNNVEFGIVWPTETGWERLGLFESSIQPFDVDTYSLVELNGDCSRTLYPNGRRLPQSTQVIDANHARVIKTVNELFSDGFSGQSVASIVDTIHNHMQTYDYIQDVKHEWQTLTTIFNNNGGDCEDLAHLEASLLARAFVDAGMLDAQSRINLVAGFVGQGAD